MAAYLFLRPAEPQARLGAADAERVRELLGKYGDRDSLGYFALRNDKSVIWSATGKACICYRVVSGVMLASGDPIGDPEAWPGVIGPFLDEAARHAWAPAVMGCSELGAEVWCREGNLTALELGTRPSSNVADFSLSGRCMRNVRQMVNRVAQERLHRRGPAGRRHPGRRAEGHRADRRLLARQPDRARLLHGPGPDRRRATMTACWPPPPRDGAVRAVLQLVPWGADGLSLDLMRRDKNAQPGLNDFLITETIKAAPCLGREADLAELRGVPGRARARRADRRRPGAEGLAVGADLRVPVVPDRVAVQVQRQVLPGLAAAVLRLPEHQGRAPDRAGRAGGRGLPGLAAARAAPHRAQDRAWARSAEGCAVRRRFSGDARRPDLFAGLPSADRCLVMGVVNVTPDSFSDGGQWFGADAAIAHGLELMAAGADLVDVGGESTRPGAQRIEAGRGSCGGSARSSPSWSGRASRYRVDTMRARVAGFALEAGAQLVNDVSGGLADPDMPRLVAAAGVSYVVVHWRGHSRQMYAPRGLRRRGPARSATSCPSGWTRYWPPGSTPAGSVIDPGLGFGKRPEHNWPLLTHLGELAALDAAHLPGPGRRVPQALPRQRAGRSGRHAPAVRGVRRGHRGHHRPGRRGGRLVRAGAPGPAERRRRAGGRRLAHRRGRPTPGRRGPGRCRPRRHSPEPAEQA